CLACDVTGLVPVPSPRVHRPSGDPLRGPRQTGFLARAIMGALHRHCSLKETNNEASSPVGTLSGEPLSTATDNPERRPAARQAEARAEGPEVGRADGSGSPRSARGAGDLGVALRGATMPGPVLAVDAMGGDYAPDEIVAGALAAQREHGL